MKALISNLMLAIIGSSMCSSRIIVDSAASFDVFPLKPNLHFTYDYYRQSSITWVVIIEESEVDSGSVEYIVHDSTNSGDTTTIWNVEERQALWHHFYSTYSNPEDTTFWTYDTVSFALSENLADLHELTASSLIWHFPLSNPETTQSVHRFSDSSNVLITKYWRTDTPDCGDGTDSIWFSDSCGLYRKESSFSYGICHNTQTSGYTSIRLRGNPVLSVRESAILPFEIELKQNYPNPFNPTTKIEYVLSKATFVSLRLYDLLGREVSVLVDDHQPAGIHSILLKLNNLTTGIYFYRLYAGSLVETKKLILLK